MGTKQPITIGNHNDKVLAEDGDLEQWAACRETSFEIAQAIERKAGDCGGGERLNRLLMHRIWYDPTEEETSEVLRIAFSLCDDSSLYWGEEEFSRP